MHDTKSIDHWIDTEREIEGSHDSQYDHAHILQSTHNLPCYQCILSFLHSHYIHLSNYLHKSNIHKHSNLKQLPVSKSISSQADIIPSANTCRQNEIADSASSGLVLRKSISQQL